MSDCCEVDNSWGPGYLLLLAMQMLAAAACADCNLGTYLDGVRGASQEGLCTTSQAIPAAMRESSRLLLRRGQNAVHGAGTASCISVPGFRTQTWGH